VSSFKPSIVALVGVVLLSACSLSTDEPRQRGATTPADAASGDPSSVSGQPASSAGDGEPVRVDPREHGLDLGFGEFAITLESDEIRPGPVTFVIRNGGALVHGFEIEGEDDGGDSSGPGSGGLKLEGPEFGPGDVVRIRADLPAGVYEIECFVADHDERGMRATLVVRRGAPLIREARADVDPGVVQISDFAFSPQEVEVELGTELTWTNDDPTAHTVRAAGGAFDSGSMDPGARFTFRFDERGTFRYACSIHPAMRATVRVA
jgi:plastocyanin